jgi:hypothetical protein
LFLTLDITLSFLQEEYYCVGLARIPAMGQGGALYAHMNKKRKKKKNTPYVSLSDFFFIYSHPAPWLY